MKPADILIFSRWAALLRAAIRSSKGRKGAWSPVVVGLSALGMFLGGCQLFQPRQPLENLYRNQLQAPRPHRLSLAGIDLQRNYRYQDLAFAQAAELIRAMYRDTIRVRYRFDVTLVPPEIPARLPAWRWRVQVGDSVIAHGRVSSQTTAPVTVEVRAVRDISALTQGLHPDYVYRLGFRHSYRHPSPVASYFLVFPEGKPASSESPEDAPPRLDTLRFDLIKAWRDAASGESRSR